MTVQELIDELLKVEDKSKQIDCEDPFLLTFDIHTVKEQPNSVKFYIA